MQVSLKTSKLTKTAVFIFRATARACASLNESARRSTNGGGPEGSRGSGAHHLRVRSTSRRPSRRKWSTSNGNSV